MTLLPKLYNQTLLYNNIDHDSITQAKLQNYTITLS